VSEKTLPAPTAVGPVLASITSQTGTVRVTVDPAATTASATVRTADTSGPAADAVRNSRISQDGNHLTVTVAEMPGNVTITNIGGGATVFQSANVGGGATVFQSSGDVYAGETLTGVTIVNGQVITGGISTSRMPTVSPIEVLVTLPAGSGVQLRTRNADLIVTGPLAALDVNTRNGNVRAGIVGRLQTQGHNNDSEIDAVTEWADINSHNGNTYIGAYSGTAASLTGHNGNIELSATPLASGRIEARSHNGSIRLRGVSGRPDLEVITHTHNGRVTK
jgi:hypothetical protein